MGRGVFLSFLFCATLATASAEIKGDIMIFHAGSLSVPLQEVAAAFEAVHPGVRVLREAAGSRVCARKISDLGRACDVMASADYAVIDTLLIPEHASWNIKFAANEMSIAYMDKSKYASEINGDNWCDIVMRADVAFGRSDPDADPCGYRTVLTTLLAEKHYDIPGFSERFLKKDLRFMRPKETDLLALLETRTIDYVFIYRSVAVQHGLHWVALPDAVNLGNADMADQYASVSVSISGTTPGSVHVQQGEPMLYSVTIPHNAPNPDAAIAFVAFLLDANGIAIMERNGQPSVVPAVSDRFEDIPEALKRFAGKP